MSVRGKVSGRFQSVVLFAVWFFCWTRAPLGADQQKTTSQAQKAMAPTASVNIVHFNKAASDQAMAQVTAKPGGTPGPPRIYANYGEKVRFSWNVEACNAGTVTGSISSHGPVDLGPRVDIGNNCVRMRGNAELTLTQGGMVTLRVSATPSGPASLKEKSVEVILRGYDLEISNIDLNVGTRELVFYGRNVGEADIAAGEVQIYYRVRGVMRGPGPIIKEDWISRRNVAIPRGPRVELGRCTLPESMYAYQNLSVKTSIYGERYGFGIKEQTFPLALNPREIQFDSAILETFITAMVGDVRFNNYDPALRTAEEISVAPLKRNDSWVEIMGARDPFTPEIIRLHFSVTGSWSGREYVGVSYRGFINNISLSGRPRLVLKPGQLGLRLVFNTAVSREVKGFVFRDSIYNDEMGPDVDFTRLEVEVLIRPHLEDQRIRVGQITSEIDISLAFAGGWNILDRFRPNISSSIESIVRQLVREQVTAKLDTDANKQAVEVFFDGLLRARNVNSIRSVTVNERGVTLSVF